MANNLLKCWFVHFVHVLHYFIIHFLHISCVSKLLFCFLLSSELHEHFLRFHDDWIVVFLKIILICIVFLVDGYAHTYILHIRYIYYIHTHTHIHIVNNVIEDKKCYKYSYWGRDSFHKNPFFPPEHSAILYFSSFPHSCMRSCKFWLRKCG